MQITQSIDLNLSIDGIPPQLHMPQGDGGRIIYVSLWDGATIYSPPDGTMCMLRFRKPDGTGGLYDTAEDGTKISLVNNVVTIPVALQVLAVSGPVHCQVELYAPAAEGELLSANRLATFAFILFVAPSVYPDAEIISGEYINIVSEALKAALDEVVDGLNEHQPHINADGKWELWDAATNAYVATEYTAIGKDGTKWWTYAYPIGITASLEKIMSKSNLPDAAIGDYVLHTMSNAGIVFEITGETADGSSWVVKEKCTLRGNDGITPHIGTNGNWFLGTTDTNKPSRGATGAKGDPGEPGAAGKDGITPHIGDNGNWYLGATDTGKPSRGATGAKGDPGDDYVLTAADKSEIAGLVLAEIPNGDEVAYG